MNDSKTVLISDNSLLTSKESFVEINNYESNLKSANSNNEYEEIANVKCSIPLMNDIQQLTKTTVNLHHPDAIENNKLKINKHNTSNENVSSDTESDTHSEFNNNKRIIEFEAIIVQQRHKITEYEAMLRDLEQKYVIAKNNSLELDCKLKKAVKQSELATKEKETVVMRYAVSEKAVLENRAAREYAEKKAQEALKEKDLLQSKLSVMANEKARICQMLDSKCHECKTAQQELDRYKSEISNLETKLKWSQNSLRTELEYRKETNLKNEMLTNQLQEITASIEQTKRDAQESIKKFYRSEENRAYVLDQQVKEQQAILILEKHEREERDQKIATLKSELERIQKNHHLSIIENNTLSLKVQQLEKERLEMEQKLSELRAAAEKHRQDEAKLNSLASSIEKLKLQLSHEQEEHKSSCQQVSVLKERNSDLEADMEACRVREADMLQFTEKLTDKNVRLQSGTSVLENQLQQMNSELLTLKRTSKEYETTSKMLAEQLAQETALRKEENQLLARHLAEKTKLSEQLSQQLEDQRGENHLIKRKMELSIKEITKELQQCRKQIEHYEKSEANTNSLTSSNSSLNVTDGQSCSPALSNATESLDHKIQPETPVDRQTLLNHINKLQRTSAKKSEKIDFLEEHVQTLLTELQRKSRLLQTYMLREQSGLLSSNKMDDNKAKLAKLSGVMASMYNSSVQDNKLTLELSLDINRKLQALLEDTLLKNIMLKENIATLGAEIDKLNQKIQSLSQISLN